MVVAVIETKTYTADECLTLEIESDIGHESSWTHCRLEQGQSLKYPRIG
jgi:hypothetical protein